MSHGHDLDEALSLREAWDQLVDPALIEVLRAKIEDKRAYKAHAVAVCGPLPRVRRGGDRPPQHPLRSNEYKALERDLAAAQKSAMMQFFSQLSLCCVMARTGSPVAPLTKIPPSALPSPGGESRSRLRISSYDESRMVFGFGDNKITYYDVQVWPSDGQEIDSEETDGEEPNGQESEWVEHEALGRCRVQATELGNFLTNWVASRAAGDPGLTQDALLAAVKCQFPNHTVARQWVRDWIGTDMPMSKRFQVGRRPRPLGM